MSDWRVVQMFLSPRHPALYEVEMDLDAQGALRCTCPAWKVHSSCRHTKYVRRRALENGGGYPLMLHTRAGDVNLDELIEDPEKFRHHVVNFGRVEVL